MFNNVSKFFTRLQRRWQGREHDRQQTGSSAKRQGVSAAISEQAKLDSGRKEDKRRLRVRTSQRSRKYGAYTASGWQSPWDLRCLQIMGCDIRVACGDVVSARLKTRRRR